MRKTENEYSVNINEKDVVDNKNVLECGKPILPDKVKSKEKVTLVEHDKIIMQDINIAE